MNDVASGLSELADRYPSSEAVIDGRTGRAISFRELDALVARAQALLEPASCVVSLLPNSVENLVLFLAALRGGHTFAPLSVHTTAEELARWSGLVHATTVVAPPRLSEPLAAAVDASNLERLSPSLDGSFDWLPSAGAAPATAPATVMLRTSGSTGEPKAMVIDGDRLWAAARVFVNFHSFVDGGSRFLNNLPMSYLGGLFNLTLIPLAGGASTVVTDAFSGLSFLTFWQDVERFGISVLWLVPTIVSGLLDVAERTSRQALVRAEAKPIAGFLGTAPITTDKKAQFEATFGIPLLENYALSETTFLTSETLQGRSGRQKGSVGEVLPWVQLRISDDQASFGEIEVKTPFLFVGYLGADGEVELPVTEDGFFRTGDVGHLTPRGSLVLDGRTRDIIKKGGYLVSLREPELTAERHPRVARAAAVSIPHDFYGEDYVILVVGDGSVGPVQLQDEVQALLTASLPRHLWPMKVEVVDELPTTETGKIRRSVLADQWQRRREQ